MERRTDFVDELREFNSQFREPPAPKEYDWDRVHRFDDDESDVRVENVDDFYDPRIQIDGESDDDHVERYGDYVDFVRGIKEVETWPELCRQIWSAATRGERSSALDELAASVRRKGRGIESRCRLLATVAESKNATAKSAIESIFCVATFVVKYTETVLLLSGALPIHRDNTIRAWEHQYASILNDAQLHDAIAAEKARLHEILYNTAPRPHVTLEHSVRDDIEELGRLVKGKRRQFCKMLLTSSEPDHRISLPAVAKELGWLSRDKAWSGLMRDINKIAHDEALNIYVYRDNNQVLAVHTTKRPPKKSSRKTRRRSKSAAKQRY